MAVDLRELIGDVEQRAPAPDPLARLAAASMTAGELGELADALLAHFVDQCRRDGRSWSEIGVALGVSKQAVQKRFTRSPGEPNGWEHFTERTRKVVLEHAPAAAVSLGHGWVGTEHVLIGFWGGTGCLASTILERLDVTRARVVEAVQSKIDGGAHRDPTFTPRAWSAVNGASQEALALGHDYIGTEHVLLSMVGGVGGLADEVLAEMGATRETIHPVVLEVLSGFIRRPTEARRRGVGAAPRHASP